MMTNKQIMKKILDSFPLRAWFIKVPFALSLTLSLAACDISGATRSEVDYAARRLTYTKAERIREVSRIIQERVPLPSPVLDAFYDEDWTDETEFLGPSDFTAYMYIKIAPADMEKWNVVLREKSSAVASYHLPDRKYLWWVDKTRFPTLEFYEPRPLSTLQGWIGVSRSTGEIWIIGYTS